VPLTIGFLVAAPLSGILSDKFGPKVLTVGGALLTGGSGMIAAFQNSAFVLSIGIFFTLMVAGLSGKLPWAMFSGLTAQDVPAATAASGGFEPAELVAQDEREDPQASGP
jgi:MFS family permease